MTNFDLIRNKEYKYLIYLVDELSKIETAFKKLAADRDVKLTFILKEDASEGYHSAIERIDEIKLQINDLDLFELVSPGDKSVRRTKLEDIGDMINQLINYYEYFSKVCEEVKV